MLFYFDQNIYKVVQREGILYCIHTTPISMRNINIMLRGRTLASRLTTVTEATIQLLVLEETCLTQKLQCLQCSHMIGMPRDVMSF